MKRKMTYLTAFLTLLAGFAVLTGCTGEGLGVVPNGVSNTEETDGASGEGAGGSDGERAVTEETPVVAEPTEPAEPPAEPVEPPKEEKPIPPNIQRPYNQESLGSYPGLDAETELQVKQAWVNFWGGEKEGYSWRNIHLNRYFGNYDGCVVISVYPSLVQCTGTGVRVGGKVFIFSSSPVYFLAWKNGRLYDVRQAYKYGILTDDMVNDMYERYVAYYYPDYPRQLLELNMGRIHFFFSNEKTYQIIMDMFSGAIVFSEDDPDDIPVDPQELEEAGLVIMPWPDYSEELWPDNGWGPGEIRRKP